MVQEITWSLQGKWVTLEPLTEQIQAAIDELDQKRALLPQMGGMIQRQALSESFYRPLAIRIKSTDTIVGTLASQELPGYEGVVYVLFYADRTLSRLGFTLESCFLYIDYLFHVGARKLHMEVLEFHAPILNLMQICGFPVHARMRKSNYIAGHYWDALVFGCCREDWEIVRKKYQILLPQHTS